MPSSKEVEISEKELKFFNFEFNIQKSQSLSNSIKISSNRTRSFMNNENIGNELILISKDKTNQNSLRNRLNSLIIINVQNNNEYFQSLQNSSNTSSDSCNLIELDNIDKLNNEELNISSQVISNLQKNNDQLYLIIRIKICRILTILIKIICKNYLMTDSLF